MDAARLKTAFDEIEKEYGAGTVFRLGSNRKLNVQALPTTILPFDSITGVGGIPRSRITEIFGPPSGGKTTLTLHTIAEAQRYGGLAGFIDVENALDPKYAKGLGVNVDDLIVSQPDNGEQALEVCEKLIKSEQFDIIVVDSVAALVPKKELEGEMGDPQMGSLARLMSQAMRKLNAATARSKTALVFINQIRNKVGVIFGSPETTPGGEALKFFSSMRIVVRPGQKMKDGEQIIGSTNKMQVVKNKVASPFKECVVENLYGLGFSNVHNNLDVFVEHGALEKKGNRFFSGEHEIGNGRDAAIETLQFDTDLYNRLYLETRGKMYPTPVVPAEAK